MKKNKSFKVSIVMGSQSDYKTMQLVEKTLKKIGVSFETKIISAHRTPKRMYEFASNACLLYTSPSPRDRTRSRMPSSA